MLRFRPSDATVKLLAAFAALTCLYAASLLWTLNQFSPSSWLTVAVGQEFSSPEDYFSAVRFWVWLQLAGTALAAAALAWWLHAHTVRPMHAATVAAQHISSGNLAAAAKPDGIQNNKLLSTMQEMNTCLCGIIADTRKATGNIAAGASELARSGQQLLVHSADQRAPLAQAAAAFSLLHASIGQHADTARLASELAGAAAAAGSRADVALDALEAALGAGAACARQIALINSAVDDIAALGDTLALSAALEAARAAGHGQAFAVVAGEVRTLAQRAGGAARALRQLTEAAQREASAGAALSARLRPGMHEAAAGWRRVCELNQALAGAAQAQLAGAELARQSLAAADLAGRRHAALAAQSAASAAAVRDEAGALVRALAHFALGPQHASTPLIHLAHSNPEQAPRGAGTASRKRSGGTHLVSIL